MTRFAPQARHLAGPHFLGIGAPRCGTTWLYEVLRQHPGLWLPPIKELHYFDSIDTDSRPNLGMHRPRQRLARHLVRRLRHYAAVPLLLARTQIAHRLTLSPSWDFRYLGPGDSINWYRSLFAQAARRGAVTGEITPAYFAISKPTIERIRRETPVRRIVLLLRDPVEASWSMVKKNLRDGLHTAAAEDVGRLIQLANSPGLRTRYAYGDNLERWLSVFGRDELFIGYYDDLQSDPQRLLDDICRFLEVTPFTPANGMRERVNSTQGIGIEIPAEVRAHLAGSLSRQLDKLHELLGPRVSGWGRC